MKLIAETIDNSNFRFITEEGDNGKKNYYIEGVFMQGEIQNKNNRMYPIKILEKEVNRYNNEYVKKNRAYGELGHPQGPTINLDRVSHLIKEIKQDGSNFIGKAKIMDTPMGRIVKNLMDEGAQLGVSTRGMGSLKVKNGINEVQDDFVLATAADIVADPSAPEAFVNGIMEGVEWLHENNHWVRVAEETKKRIKQGNLTEADKLRLFENFLKKL